jgi:hypothetical protein
MYPGVTMGSVFTIRLLPLPEFCVCPIILLPVDFFYYFITVVLSLVVLMECMATVYFCCCNTVAMDTTVHAFFLATSTYEYPAAACLGN